MIKTEETFDPSVEFIDFLINSIQSSKIKSGDPQLKDMTLREIKRKLKEDNIRYTIYPTKDGRLKIRTPFQKCCKNELDIMIELFRHHYGHDPDMDISVQGIFEEWIKKWSDIDWNNKTVFIHSQIVRQKDSEGHEYFEYRNRTKGKKKEANRFQPLSDDAIRLLKKQRAANPFGEYIFMYKDKPLMTNTVNHHLMRICEKVGVEYLSSHKIRFWSVVNMSKALNPAEVQYMAGHLDPATTDHYRKRVSRLEGVDKDVWNDLYGMAK